LVDAAEKIAVSVCVLVFSGVSHADQRDAKAAVVVLPGLAMLAYGYVFYMGFMNYYLSLGLACLDWRRCGTASGAEFCSRWFWRRWRCWRIRLDFYGSSRPARTGYCGRA